MIFINILINTVQLGGSTLKINITDLHMRILRFKTFRNSSGGSQLSMVGCQSECSLTHLGPKGDLMGKENMRGH